MNISMSKEEGGRAKASDDHRNENKSSNLKVFSMNKEYTMSINTF